MPPQIEVRPVKTAKERLAFVKMPWRIYRDDPRWVPPVISEQAKYLNPKRGEFFSFGDVELFLAYRDGKPVGRVSAHVNRRHDEQFADGKGFFGFFDCENDPEAARALFASAEKYLARHQRKSIEGPYCFTIYDEIGVLVEGFDYDPYIMTLYNKPYYGALLEQTGFEKCVDWYAFRCDLGTGKSVNKKYGKLSKRILSRASLTMRQMDPGKNFQRDAGIIKHIFKNAFEQNWGHVPMSEPEFERIAGFIKMIICPELSLIAEVDGVPVGFSLVIYDANHILKNLNGRLFPLGYWKLLTGLKKTNRVRLILMGMLEEYRGKGYELPFYVHIAEKCDDLGISECELSIVVENNTGLLRTLDKIPDMERNKTYRIYHKAIGQ